MHLFWLFLLKFSEQFLILLKCRFENWDIESFKHPIADTWAGTKPTGSYFNVRAAITNAQGQKKQCTLDGLY